MRGEDNVRRYERPKPERKVKISIQFRFRFDFDSIRFPEVWIFFGVLSPKIFFLKGRERGEISCDLEKRGAGEGEGRTEGISRWEGEGRAQSKKKESTQRVWEGLKHPTN